MYDVTEKAKGFLKTPTSSSSSGSLSIIKNYTMHGADVVVEPASTLGFGTRVTFDSEFPITIQLPFFEADGFVDEVYAGKLSAALSTNSSGVAVKGKLIMNDVPELADKIRVISAAALSSLDVKPEIPGGSAIPAYLKIGISASNSIDLFSKMKLSEFKLESMFGNRDTPAVASDTFKTNITNWDVKALPGKVLGCSALVSLNNGYPISLSGLGYLHGEAAIEKP